MERKKPRTALVDGARGHVGSFLVNLLADDGWEVVATDLPPEERAIIATKENIFDIPDDRLPIDRDNVEFLAADLTDKQSLYPLFENQAFDAIFHTASLYDYFAPLDLLERVNVGGVKNLLEVYEKTSSTTFSYPSEFPRFLHWSTCGVYGQPQGQYGKHWEHPADETAPFNPPNDYSTSKMHQEELLQQWWREKHVPIVILRPAPIYGPYQRYGMFHIFHLVRTVGSVPIVSLYPRWRKLRMPMVHVEDVARAAKFLAETPAENVVGEAFNLIDDCGLQEDFMTIVARLLDADYSNISVPWFIYRVVAQVAFSIALEQNRRMRTKGMRPRYDAPMAEYITHQYWFSNMKLKDLGFTFKYPDMQSGLENTIDWYLAHGWLKREKWEEK
ncbi:MAG TPA: NAD(P)-dependent oxidoreductase [Candidatus Lokiarchaeia archaeon]|nr:NAD(P)-dependent oxidoreductase [Candidatus Lokiarchaeia archaeon]